MVKYNQFLPKCMLHLLWAKWFWHQASLNKRCHANTHRTPCKTCQNLSIMPWLPYCRWIHIVRPCRLVEISHSFIAILLRRVWLLMDSISRLGYLSSRKGRIPLSRSVAQRDSCYCVPSSLSTWLSSSLDHKRLASAQDLDRRGKERRRRHYSDEIELGKRRRK